MEPLAEARGSLDAWIRRHTDARVAAVADGRTAADPLAAFPDRRVVLVGAAPAAAGVIAVQWPMRGMITGPFRGAPPTGRAALPAQSAPPST